MNPKLKKRIILGTIAATSASLIAYAYTLYLNFYIHESGHYIADFLYAVLTGSRIDISFVWDGIVPVQTVANGISDTFFGRISGALLVIIFFGIMLWLIYQKTHNPKIKKQLNNIFIVLVIREIISQLVFGADGLNLKAVSAFMSNVFIGFEFIMFVLLGYCVGVIILIKLNTIKTSFEGFNFV